MRMSVKILLIDDETDYSETVGFWLMAHGYQVRTASSGVEGLRAIEEELPDIVFLDFLMPGMDGIDTLREIRGKHLELPVIMVSAYASEDKMKEAGSIGISGIFSKGAELSEAARLITETLTEMRGGHKRNNAGYK